MKNSNTKLKRIKLFIVIILWFIVIYAVFQGFSMYNYQQDHPNKEYNWSVGDKIPEEVVIKRDSMNKLSNTINFGLFFVIIFFVVDYKHDPENHFITKISEYIKKLKLEE